jgi:outer membrane lipoprotein SlyB
MTSPTKRTALALALIFSLSLTPLVAQGTGDPDFDPRVAIQYGRVVKAEKVKIDGNGRIAGGATLGGMTGLVYGSKNNKSRKDTRKRALGGAAVGAAIGKKAGGGSHEIMQYTVRLLDGQVVQVASEQDDFREADCVVIEAVEDMTNVRRVPERACEPAAQPVVQELRPEFEEEAQECAEAKRQLLDAETEEAAATAVIKVELLCDG